MTMTFWISHQKQRQTSSTIANQKNFCTAQKTINKMKRQPTKWEKTFANYMISKGLIFKISKELKQFSIKKKTEFKNGQNT